MECCFSGDRKHFIRFNENMEARNTWAQKLLDDFKGKVMKARNAQKSPSNSPPNAGSSPSHTASPSQNRKTTPNKQSQNAKPQQTSPQHKQTKLLESVFVFRMEDFTVYRVSTPDAKRNAPKKFLTSDKKQLFLPPDMSSVHVEYTSYYFPEGVDFPGMNTDVNCGNSAVHDGVLQCILFEICEIEPFSLNHTSKIIEFYLNTQDSS